ncbi:MAG: transglutaminase-like domain-containing protein [Ignavibacteria bacterium]|nr:transglutaminase-like domain-containing protein [Ignavibacteria bacterium]
MKHLYTLVIISVLLILSCNSTRAQIITSEALLSNIESRLSIQKELAGGRSEVIFGVLSETKNRDEELALKFILAYLPLSDMADYSGKYFLENVRMSLKAKTETSWGRIIPEDVFVHFVLPVRVNNENLDNFRTEMYDEIMNRVKNLSMHEAALEINHWCHEKVTYRPSDERTSAPLSTIRCSYGRCGEESTFFVAALRTAGIPARQVYTPRWAHTDDNHAWVEIWVDGDWHFLGACEPSPNLDMGWFAAPSTRTMLVNTRVYGWYEGTESVITSEARFAEINRTGKYTPVKKIFVKVVNENKEIVKDAKVEFQLYNYAEFFPLAKSFTNPEGPASFTTGYGDLMIWANKENFHGYKVARIRNSDTVEIIISDKFADGKFEEYHLVPPDEQPVINTDGKNQKENERRLRQEDSIRNLYMCTFKDSAWSANFINELGINDVTAYRFITKSSGNWKEITSFLKDTKQTSRIDALKLLSVISEKDLRDTRNEILADHLTNALKYKNNFHGNEKIWEDYILSGRISYEMMTAWRKPVYEKMKSELGESSISPDKIINWIKKNIKIDKTANLHSRAPLTPAGVLDLRSADAKSRDIFFAAVCRAFGIPARLNPQTIVPQYLSGTTWKDVSFEPKPLVNEKKGYIKLINAGSFDPKYYINFTIELFREGVYRSLEFEEEKPLSAFPSPLEVPAGQYMLVTGNRKQDGSVLNNIYFFEVTENSTTEVSVRVSDINERQAPTMHIITDDFTVMQTGSDKSVVLSDLTNKLPFVIAIIEPDKEPTKHLMTDLKPVKKELDEWGGTFIFVLKKGSADEKFNSSIFNELPSKSIFVLDDSDKLLNFICAKTGYGKNAELPFVFSADSEGKINYYINGYSIGIGGQLLKTIRK